MRAYNQESFCGIPSNYPLKSPSPDLKAKNSIFQTVSPHNTSIRKAFDQLTPTNRSKKQNYSNYCTLPNYNQQIPQSIQAKIQKIFANTEDSHQSKKKYSSTQTKGNYGFEEPKQFQKSMNKNKLDLITTEKKNIYLQTQNEQDYIPISPKNKDLHKVIQQKDLIISELKDMINLMTENGKYLKTSQKVFHEQQYQKLKNDVKILTIQNQKLSQVIEKFNKQNSIFANNDVIDIQLDFSKDRHPYESSMILQKKLNNYQDEINRLRQILKEKEMQNKNQTSLLDKKIEDLTIECKFYENQKERFSKQNERLINLLRLKDKQKQTCYKNYSYFDKQQNANSEQIPNSKSAKNPSQTNKITGDQTLLSNRASIQKIKAQYEQNLKQYRQNVYNQVYGMFDNVNSTLEEINEKVNSLERKIIQMQRFKDLLNQRSIYHTSSIESNDEEIKKSAIYIEDDPTSQRLSSESRRSKNALSVILQESRRDNEKLQLQLSQLRKQVDFYKQSLKQKLQNKNSDSVDQIQESYKKRIEQLEILVDELRQEKENLQNELFNMKTELTKTSLKQNQEKQSISFIENLTQMSQRQQTLKLNEKILLLSNEIQKKSLQQQMLLKKISEMEKNQDSRQKQLLHQIQHFQSIIKETQDMFKSTKKDHQNQIISLNTQIQRLEKQSVSLKIQSLHLKKHNQELSQRIEKEQSDFVNYEQNMKKIQSIIQSFKQNSEKQSFLDSINQIIINLEAENKKSAFQKSQFLRMVESLKSQILELKQEKINLTEKVVCLEEKLQLYKIQLQKSKEFYSKLLSAKYEGFEWKQIESTSAQKSIKRKGKSKIDELLESENKKIGNLIESINQLSLSQNNYSL